MALPAPPALTQGTDYTVFSTRVYCWVPTISSPAAPTLSELNAGKDLTKQISAVSGFTTSTASIDVPRAGTTFTGNLPGRKTAADSSLTFYLSQAGGAADIRSVLTEGAVGYIVIFPEGIVTGGTLDVWRVRVGSLAPSQDLEAAATLDAQFYAPIAPVTGVTIPTA